MKHTYKIHGRTCNGCRTRVENTLSKVGRVFNILVNLVKAEATIEMESHIPIEKFQGALTKECDAYTIHKLDENYHSTKKKVEKPRGNGTAFFYWLMHCDGDKTYDEPAIALCAEWPGEKYKMFFGIFLSPMIAALDMSFSSCRSLPMHSDCGQKQFNNFLL